MRAMFWRPFTGGLAILLLLCCSCCIVDHTLGSVVTPPAFPSFSIPFDKILSSVKDMGLSQSEHQDLNQYLRETSKRQTDKMEAAEGSGSSNNSNVSDSSASTAASNTSAGFDWEEALADFRSQVELLREARELRLEGNRLLGLEQWEEARGKYQEAYDMLSSRSGVMTEGTKVAMGTCRLNLALCRMKQGQYDESRQICEEVLESDPPPAIRVRCLHRRAMALIKTGPADEQAKQAAKADLEEANRLDPNDSKVSTALQKLGGVPVTRPISVDPWGDALGGIDPSFLDAIRQGGPDGGGAGGSSMLQSLLGSGAPNSGGGPSILPRLIGRQLLAMVDRPETLETVCNLLQGLTPDYIRGLAQAANLNVPDPWVQRIHRFASTTKPKDIRRWVGHGKRVYKAYRVTGKVWKTVRPLVGPLETSLTYYLLYSWARGCWLRW